MQHHRATCSTCIFYGTLALGRGSGMTLALCRARAGDEYCSCCCRCCDCIVRLAESSADRWLEGICLQTYELKPYDMSGECAGLIQGFGCTRYDMHQQS